LKAQAHSAAQPVEMAVAVVTVPAPGSLAEGLAVARAELPREQAELRSAADSSMTAHLIRATETMLVLPAPWQMTTALVAAPPGWDEQ
jgi:hypothetical protein